MKVEVEIPDNCEIIKEDNIFKIVEKKEEVNLPMSWEEYCKNIPIQQNEYYINDYSVVTCLCITRAVFRDSEADRNLLSSKEEAKAFLALMQLRRLREEWVKDFKPNWEKDNFYSAIIVDSYGDINVNMVHAPRVMLFPTIEMAKSFRSCFKELLETAKMLL